MGSGPFKTESVPDGTSLSISLEWHWHVLLTVAFSILALQPFLKKVKSNPLGLPLPPGPKGVPIFGNLFQLAKGSHSGPWLLYDKWARECGSDIVYAEAMGQPILILNSVHAVKDLMERRAPNYSDRSVPPAMDMIRMGWALTLHNYGPWWRLHRRTFHQYYNSNEVRKYQPIIEKQTLAFLRRLASNPKNFMDDTKYLFGSIIVQISYGISDPVENMKLVDDGEAVVRGFSDTLEPGRFLVDTFPILRHVPVWLPGAGWKAKLTRIGDISQGVYKGNFEAAKERARMGVQSEYPNVASYLIEKLPSEDDPQYAMQEEVAKSATLVAYVAGADTTVSSAHGLYIALANNPEVQRRAQEELDTVVGTCRIPNPSDMDRLPYVRAVVKELSRWHSVLPLAVPHTCTRDDEYRGYFIPAGTMVIGNAWAIMHDPEVFDDPMEFRPERYLEDGNTSIEVLDPENAAFGFGRRICPGRHLSNEGLTYMVASLMSVFNIEAPKDAAGNPLPVKLEPAPGFIVKPLPFEVEIIPRSPEHAALLLEI